MSDAEAILQTVRTWIADSAVAGRTLRLADSAPGANDCQVIPANDPGDATSQANPRPRLPYLTVLVALDDTPEGMDEPRRTVADLATITLGEPGDVYGIAIDDGDPITVEQAADDTASTIAVALASAIMDRDDAVSAVAIDDTIAIAGLWDAVTTTVTAGAITIDAASVPVAGVSGDRSGTVSVQGYGAGARAWLERVAIALRLPAIDDALSAAGLSVSPIGGITDLSAMLDTSIEPRFLREFRVTYQRRIELVPYDAAETLAIGATVASGDGHADLDASFTVDLEPTP